MILQETIEQSLLRLPKMLLCIYWHTELYLNMWSCKIVKLYLSKTQEQKKLYLQCTIRAKSSNQHNKQKSCDSSLISYLQVPPSSLPRLQKKVLPEIGEHFVKTGNIQIGEGYRKNEKISRTRLLPFIAQCSSHANVSLNILLLYIENLKALK